MGTHLVLSRGLGRGDDLHAKQRRADGLAAEVGAVTSSVFSLQQSRTGPMSQLCVDVAI